MNGLFYALGCLCLGVGFLFLNSWLSKVEDRVNEIVREMKEEKLKEQLKEEIKKEMKENE